MRSPTRKILSTLFTFSLLTSQLLSAHAAIIFQNDSEFKMDSDNLVIDFNNTARTTGDVYVDYGNSSTATKNGRINWSMDDERFEFTQDVQFTGKLNASGATQTRLRENAGDPNTDPEACSNVGELIVDSTNSELYICSDAGADTWVKTGGTASKLNVQASAPGTCAEGDVYYNSTSNISYVCTATDTWTKMGPEDFEAVFAADGDGTLTTGNTNFSINTGAAGDLTFDTDVFTANAGSIDFNLTSGDITTSGTFAISSSNWGITTAGNASLVNLTSTGAVNLTGASSVQIKEVASLGTCASTGELVFNTTNNIVYVCTDAGADTWSIVGGAGLRNTQLAFDPEYPNAVIYKDGSNNAGTLASDFDSTNNKNYYSWTSSNAALQDVNTKFRLTLPTDFTSVGTFTADFLTLTDAAADNKLDIIVKNITDDTVCSTSSAQVSATADTWETLTVSAATIETGCTGATSLDAGDIVEIDTKFYAKSTGNAEIGRAVLNYNN